MNYEDVKKYESMKKEQVLELFKPLDDLVRVRNFDVLSEDAKKEYLELQHYIESRYGAGAFKEMEEPAIVKKRLEEVEAYISDMEYWIDYYQEMLKRDLDEMYELEKTANERKLTPQERRQLTSIKAEMKTFRDNLGSLQKELEVEREEANNDKESFELSLVSSLQNDEIRKLKSNITFINGQLKKEYLSLEELKKRNFVKEAEDKQRYINELELKKEEYASKLKEVKYTSLADYDRSINGSVVKSPVSEDKPVVHDNPVITPVSPVENFLGATEPVPSDEEQPKEMTSPVITPVLPVEDFDDSIKSVLNASEEIKEQPSNGDVTNQEDIDKQPVLGETVNQAEGESGNISSEDPVRDDFLGKKEESKVKKSVKRGVVSIKNAVKISAATIAAGLAVLGSMLVATTNPELLKALGIGLAGKEVYKGYKQ